MVESLWFASFKSSIEPLEPKPAPINSMSCAADEDLLLLLKQIAKYIKGAGHKINIQCGSQCNRTQCQDKNNDSFSGLDESDDLKSLDNSSGDLTTDL